MDADPTLSHIVRHLRQATGLSQSDFADMIGTTQTTVSRWETGSQTPNRTMRRRLLEELRRRQPPAARVIETATHHDYGWSLITDSSGLLVAASQQVRASAPAVRTGEEVWPLLLPDGPAALAEDRTTGLTSGLILIRQRLLRVPGLPAGSLLAAQTHPLPCASGGWLILTRGHPVTAAEADRLRASGWVCTLYPTPAPPAGQPARKNL